MEIPLKTQAIGLLRTYPNVPVKDIIRILETVRECYSVATTFSIPDEETLESVAEKQMVYDELNSFISLLKQ